MQAIHTAVENICDAEVDLGDLEYANLTYHFLEANQLLEKIGKLTNTLITTSGAKGAKGLPSKVYVTRIAGSTTG